MSMIPSRLTLVLLLTFAAAILALPATAQSTCGDCNANGTVAPDDGAFAALLASNPALRTGARVFQCDADPSDDLVTILDAPIIAGSPPPPTTCLQCGDCDGSGGAPDGADRARLIAHISGAMPQPAAGTTLRAACNLDTQIPLVTWEDLIQFDSGNFDCVACADCNLDGTVDIVDALVANQHASGLITLQTGTSQFNACDVNGSGTVTAVDALLIAQAAAGLNPPLACP